MYITEGEKIKNILAYGAKSSMTLEEIILNEIREWDNSPVKADMIQGNRYYRNEHGSGMVNGFVRKLSKQKTDYLLSKPFSVTSEDKKHSELLAEVFTPEYQMSLKNTGTQAVNKGIGWQQVYFEDNHIAFRVIPSEEVIPLWENSQHSYLQSVIRTYYRTEYEGKTKKKVRHVEYWDKDGVRRYIMEGSQLIPDVEMVAEESHFSVNGSAYNWERVPFVAFKYNGDELPLLKGLQGAIDDYDKQKKTISELLLSVPNYINVIKNYGGVDLEEFMAEVKKFRAIKVEGDGGVDKLQADIDISAYDTFMQQARKDIYEFGRGVDTQATDLGNASGQALKFRYADLDNDCNDMEAEFSFSLQNILWFVNRYFMIMGKGDYTAVKTEFTFNRDIIVNEAEAITECASSKDIISDETIMKNHPWVTDVAEEMLRMQKQKEEAAKWQAEGFGMVGNKPPEEIDEK